MNTTNAIKKLLHIVDELRKEYPHKRFTLDGRLVGDLGEVIVAEHYAVTLFNKIEPRYDGKSSDGKMVQVKATFNKTLGFPSNPKEIPDYYIGIKINNDGSFEEIYNGPGRNIYVLTKHLAEPKNKLHNISIEKLKKLNRTIPATEQVKKVS